jgi:hypothetical protein
MGETGFPRTESYSPLLQLAERRINLHLEHFAGVLHRRENNSGWRKILVVLWLYKKTCARALRTTRVIIAHNSGARARLSAREPGSPAGGAADVGYTPTPMNNPCKQLAWIMCLFQPEYARDCPSFFPLQCGGRCGPRAP